MCFRFLNTLYMVVQDTVDLSFIKSHMIMIQPPFVTKWVVTYGMNTQKAFNHATL